MKPDESWGAIIVAYYDPHGQAPRFRRYYGLLFGLPHADPRGDIVQSC